MRLWIAECATCGRTIEMSAASVPADLTIGSHRPLAADGETVQLDVRCPGSFQPASWTEEPARISRTRAGAEGRGTSASSP
jgi:hypothetical protein